MLKFRKYKLEENNIDYINQKYKNLERSNDDDGHIESHKIVNHFAMNADPSEDKKYTDWIVDKYKRNHFRQNDHKKISDMLNNFEENKKYLDKKNINHYNSLDDLASALKYSEFNKPEFKDEQILKYLNDPNKSMDDKLVLMHHPKVKVNHLLQTINTPNQSTFLRKIASDRISDINNSSLSESFNLEDPKYRDLNNFIQFASKELGIRKLPTIRYVGKEEDTKRAFGHFFSGKKKTEITIRVIDRHPIDIMRTLAHELCHWKQYENNVNSSETSKEDYANAMAGRIMRKFDIKYPGMFKKHVIREDGTGAVPANAVGSGNIGAPPPNNSPGYAGFSPLLKIRKIIKRRKK